MKRGEVHSFAAPRGVRGREQRGRRYAVVLQADALEALSTVVVAPTSTRALPAAFRPSVGVQGKRTCVLVDQLAAVDLSRLGRRVGRLSWDEMASVDDALKVMLALI